MGIADRGFSTGVFSTALSVIERDVENHIKKVVTTLHEELLDASPCYSGALVANWQVTDGTPNNIVIKHDESTEIGENVSQMPLGTEPRRAANEAIARQSLAKIDFTDIKPVYTLFDNAEHAVAAEFGELPANVKPRSVGFTQRAIQATLRKVK